MPLPDATQPGQVEGPRLTPTNKSPVQVIAVSSGKGGVGKTNVSVNLSVALADLGKRTLLLDADLGLANVDVMLGLSPRYTLWDVIEGRCRIQDTVIDGPRGLKVVPAASGKQRMAELSDAQHVGLVNAFSELDQQLDVMVVDTAAGISDSVLTFTEAAQEIIVVVCNEPASITDAYALIKVLSRERGVRRVQVLSNMTRSIPEGREPYDKLAKVSERFLDVTLNFLGAIPHDDWLRRAVQRQQAVVEAFPAAPSSLAFQQIARQIEQWRTPDGPRGHVEFFVERLVAGGAAA